MVVKFRLYSTYLTPKNTDPRMMVKDRNSEISFFLLVSRTRLPWPS